MPLQNRCTPFGELVAVEARGTIMGNRGGRFHRDDRTLSRRRWASHHWICCRIDYKGAQHDPMGTGWTSVFFLDEVTALAAGHRPCFYCRRHDAVRFLSLADPFADPAVVPGTDPAPRLRAHAADRVAHVQRRTRQPDGPVDGLPDGAMVAVGDTAYAVRGEHLQRWSFDGYTDAVPRASVARARPLTPQLYLGVLAAGFEPAWHPTAANP
jgi:hypothetical protein